MALSKIVENSLADEAVSSAKLKDFSAAVDLNGVELVLDADADTSITADTDDRIDFKIAGVEHFSFSNSSGDTIIKPMVDAKDIKFQQYDGRTLLDINDGGFVGIANGATGPGTIRIFEDTDNGSNYVGLAAGSISSSLTFTLPTADGSSGQFLKTDGSGALSFDTVSSAADDLTTGDAAVTLATSAGNITIDAQGNDTDIIFKGTDGSSDTTFLTIDGSDAGTLIANHNLELGTDASAILFGADNEVTLTHVHDTGLLLTDSGGTPTLQFHDANESISSDGGHLIFTSNGVSFDFPSADGSNGQALVTNGSGVISFGDVAANTPSSADGQALGSASLEWSDLFLADGGTIQFGNDQEVRLIHNADKGLLLKHTATADDKPVILTLQTGETDMAANDVIGKIEFQAPDEGTGTDAVLVSGAIQAIAEGDHSSSSNATSLQFMTGASEAATAKMTINSAGKVGIGTTTMTRTLNITDTTGGASTGIQLIGANDGTQFINFGDTDDSNIGEINYDHSTNKMLFRTNDTYEMSIFNGVVGMGADAGNADLGTGLHIKTADSGASANSEADELVIEHGNAIGGMSFLAATDGVSKIAFGDSGDNDIGMISYSHDDNHMLFFANAVERLRIAANGEVSVNDGQVGTGAAVFKIKGAVNNDVAIFTHGTSSSANEVLFRFRDGSNTDCGTIGINPNSNSVAYNTSSDYRLKENESAISDGITRLKQLKPYRFNWKSNSSGDKVDGFFAHEVSSIVPEAISGEKDGFEKYREHQERPEDKNVGDFKLDDNGDKIPDYQQIDQAKLVPVLTAALKEAITKIETLETKVQALEDA